MASDSIRQADEVLVSIASPMAPGTASVGASAAWKRSPELSRTEHDKPDRDGQDSRVHQAPTRAGRRGILSIRAQHFRRLDASPQGGRGLDLGCGGTRELDRALLLGEPVCQLRRRRSSLFECRHNVPARVTRPRAPRARRAPKPRPHLGDGVSWTWRHTR